MDPAGSYQPRQARSELAAARVSASGPASARHKDQKELLRTTILLGPLRTVLPRESVKRACSCNTVDSTLGPKVNTGS
jgi:hypothetical protein